MNLSTVLLLAIANYVPEPLTRCECPKCREQAKLFVDAIRGTPVVDSAVNGNEGARPSPRVVAQAPLAVDDGRDAEAKPPVELPDMEANIRLHMAKRNRGLSTETRQRYQEMIVAECEKHGVSPALIAALISCESSFNAEARSSSGALGLGQLMPQTLADLGVDDPFDPEQNIRACTQLMAQYLKKWKGDPKQYRLAVASYRLGYGAVIEAGGVPDSPSAQEFVAKVLSLAAELGMHPQE